MRSSKTVTLVLSGILAAGLVSAQDRRQPSPGGTAATQVGDKWIEIEYSRPILRGRTAIFGKGADYGKQVNGGAPVWRAGANTTTRLKTEVPITLGGKALAPGEYSLFVDLKEKYEDLPQILESHLQGERDAIEIYTLASAKCQDADMRKSLEQLKAEEEQHLNIITRALNRL